MKLNAKLVEDRCPRVLVLVVAAAPRGRLRFGPEHRLLARVPPGKLGPEVRAEPFESREPFSCEASSDTFPGRAVYSTSESSLWPASAARAAPLTSSSAGLFFFLLEDAARGLRAFLALRAGEAADDDEARDEARRFRSEALFELRGMCVRVTFKLIPSLLGTCGPTGFANSSHSTFGSRRKKAAHAYFCVRSQHCFLVSGCWTPSSSQ